MAHFAKINSDNIVTQVVVVNNSVITVDNQESEQAGIDFLQDLYGQGTWVQTSYTGSIRKNYAGVGYKYDSGRDAFIAPKLFNSWILSEETCTWEPPTPMPLDENKYTWNEENQTWEQLN